jgi:hypothetical protein
MNYGMSSIKHSLNADKNIFLNPSKSHCCVIKVILTDLILVYGKGTENKLDFIFISLTFAKT